VVDYPKHHVPSGTYFVGQSQPLVLQAFLGSCVGVAMYDQEAGTGGLIHLLLPEPTSSESTYHLEKYASTGLPLFLKALSDAGTRPDRLVAHVAGGALVGPLNEQDFSLDIGGRTAELVKRILHAAGTTIEKSETGGFFACSLNLDMVSGQCTIEPAGRGKINDDYKVHRPNAREIDTAMAGLQPIPQVALKVMRLIQEDDYRVSEVADEVRKDQVISARTLQLCNSALHGLKYRIDALDIALVLLGRDLFLKMVIAASVENFFQQVHRGYSLCQGGLFHHAVGTAIIAEKLAEYTQKAAPSLAYTAGLLHDIGKVVLDQYVAAAFPLFYRGLQQEDDSILDAEEKILGVNHAAVGRLLAEKWSFPESLREAIANHHYPESAEMNAHLVHIVYLADLIMSRFHAGLEMDRLDTRALASRLDRLGLTLSAFPDLVDRLPHAVFGATPELAMLLK
jgi:putative nucleotidyltransferase with HDIG domain